MVSADHLVPTSPRGQGLHTNPGQKLVSPDHLVPIHPKGPTPDQDRQQSVPGHLVPPLSGGPVHQGAKCQPGADKGQPQVKWSAHQSSQAVRKQPVIRAHPSVITLAVPEPSHLSKQSKTRHILMTYKGVCMTIICNKQIPA